MKILIILLSTLSITLTADDTSHKDIGHNNEVITNGLSSGEITDNIIKINVNGMVCDFCAQSIEKVFMKRKEVQGIKIDLNNQQVVIFLTKDGILNNEVILKLFEDAGYGVENIERKI